MGVMNVATYGYTIIAARLLGPRDYGAFAALMGLLLVVMVRLARAAGHRRATDRRRRPDDVHADRGVDPAGRAPGRAAAGRAVPGAGAASSTGWSAWTASARAALIAFAAAPLTLMGAQAGILQGERRWTAARR